MSQSVQYLKGYMVEWAGLIVDDYQILVDGNF